MRNLTLYPLRDQEIANWAQLQLDEELAVPFEKQSIGSMEPLYYRRIIKFFSQQK